ncbi:ShlB/FhaC/HecB family hemolysin secretion/activation protein [Paramixta manurensis]|uniref:ShlB/FhaC/HecB family hemolysin secretion/activation protein n=1 Tax=Paramixta manurensis TaxID=2740817 RepID=A0A6M8UMI2_9GAMM|nr:ShlB/FhaC/HecB family hemolysin secretion/activation protein [Erwiniaceae bacterium PD-1]
MDTIQKVNFIIFPILLSAFILTSGKVSAESINTPGETIGQQVKEQNNHQIEQDKARQRALSPDEKMAHSQQQGIKRRIINFPIEQPCYDIKKITYTQDDTRLILSDLSWLTRQAEGKCLGTAGIQLFVNTLQNEIIRMGYITTRINIPDQNLSEGILQFTILTGKVGNINLLEGGNNDISLSNTLPFTSGDILRLRDLEQGSFNLQRVPGSTVKIEVLPGDKYGESDINILRRQDKYWQVGAWLNDAGSRSTGRYQGGGALYLNNITSLSDTLYFSYGHDVALGHKAAGGSRNRSLGYSVPWGFWWLDLYASQSYTQQKIVGNWSSWMLNNKNQYVSAQLSHLISQTADQKSVFGLQIFNAATRYYFYDVELATLRKLNAGWKAILQQQYRFDNAIIDASLSYQRKMPWFGSSKTPEQQVGLIDSKSRIIMLDLQASTNFRIAQSLFNYSPHFNLQLTPDRLSSLDYFSIGNRWTVRGFDGEATLQQNQGWYWRNDISWIVPAQTWQPYLGLDIGKIIGGETLSGYSGKTLMGSVMGLRGKFYHTGFDFFAGTPLIQPRGFHTDPFTVGFSMQWKY